MLVKHVFVWVHFYVDSANQDLFIYFYCSIKIWDLAQQMSLNSYRGKYSFLIGTGYRYLLFSPLGSLNFVWIIIIASLCSLGWLFLTTVSFHYVPPVYSSAVLFVLLASWRFGHVGVLIAVLLLWNTMIKATCRKKHLVEGLLTVSEG